MPPTRGKRNAPPHSGFPLTRKELRSLFEPETLKRVRDYVGFFHVPEAGPRELKGEVDGRHGTYSTTLRRVGRTLVCTCTCPAAEDMNCKHAAALGLTYLQDPRSFGKMAPLDTTEARALEDVSRLHKKTTLKGLLNSLQAHGISKEQLIERSIIDSAALKAALRREKLGQTDARLNMCKLACTYLLKIFERERP